MNISAASIFASTAILLSTVSHVRATPEPERDWVFPHGLVSQLACVNGDLLVFSGWTRGYGIMAFDVSRVDQPKFKSGLVLPGYVRSVVARDDVFYIPSLFGFFVVKASGEGLHLVRNVLLDFSPKGAPGQNIVIAGNKLLVEGGSTKRLFDIVDPLAPLLDRSGYAPEARNCTSDGRRFLAHTRDGISKIGPDGGLTTVYASPIPIKQVLAANEGLLILDQKGVLALRPLADEKEAVLGTWSNIVSVARTSIGFVATTPTSWIALGDDDKGRLATVGEWPLPDADVRGCDFDGRHVYAFSRTRPRAVQIWDVTENPPRLRSAIPIAGEEGGLEITSEAIYASSGKSLMVLDPRQPAQHGLPADVITVPPSQGASSIPEAKPFGAYNLLGNSGVRRFGDTLLFAGWVVDIRNPLGPVFREAVTSPHWGSSIDGDRIALAQGIRVALLGLPDLTEIGAYACEVGQGPMLDVVLSGERLYAVDPSAFYVFDVHDPGKIKLLETHPADKPCGLASANGAVFIPSGISGRRKTLQIYSIAAGTLVERDGLIEHGVSALAASGSRLFLGDGAVVRQIDVRNPLEPVSGMVYRANRDGVPPDQRTDFTQLRVEGGALYGRKYSRVSRWTLVDPEVK